MNDVVEVIRKAEKVIVVGHIMPDGDDISSVLTMAHALRKLGKDVLPAIDWKVPWIFEELEETKEIVDYEKFKESGFDPDLMVIVDVSSPDRIGGFKELIGKVKTVILDHHKTHSPFTDHYWVDPTFGACAQMVMRVIERLGVEWDERLAHLNLMGILSDTGFLRYPNADTRVFEDATKLVKLGGKPYLISRMILENKRLEQFRLFADVLEKMKMDADGLLVYSYVSQDMYKKHGCTDEDSSGFVSELRNIRGVEVSAMFLEIRPKLIHLSMRSREWFDLAEFAKRFGGGGHARAAGATLEGMEVQEAINIVVPTLVEEIQKSKR